jgi:4-amino-4-deoxy-L-arabinose transferase-like glycosyltransferase
MSRSGKWAAGLALLTLIRLCIAAVVPLAPDEAYYWTWSRELAAGYVDHPPMVALWIRVGTSLFGMNPLGVRLLGPLSVAIGSLLLWDIAERLFPGRRSGETAAVLLNATLILGVGAIIITPDTPLLFFWTGALWAGARLATGGRPAWWIVAGLFSGLGLISKYTAAFLPIGFGLYALIAAPRSLRRPGPWLGGLLAILVFLPVVLWNADHEWAGFLRQGGRVADWRPERAAVFLSELVFGQIGLATPGAFMLFAAGIVMAVRTMLRSRDNAWSLLAALSVPPALVFLQHAVGDRVQGNWPAILYPAASVAASGLSAPVWRRWVWPSVGLGFGIVTIVYMHAVTGWPAVAGGRDPAARELFGWDGLAVEAERALRNSGGRFVAAEPYGLASELAWTLPSRTLVVNAGVHWSPGEPPRNKVASTPGILIRPERYGDAPPPGEWQNVTRLPGIARKSGGAEIERYAVFRVEVTGLLFPGPSLPVRASVGGGE